MSFPAGFFKAEILRKENIMDETAEPKNKAKALQKYHGSRWPGCSPLEKILTKTVLQKMYVEQELSSTLIAEHFGCSDCSVCKYLKKRNIQIRNLSQRTLTAMKRDPEYVKNIAGHNWKGGKIIHHTGYVLLRNPNHHRSQSNGYVLEHIVVMEKESGRKLSFGEGVHHKNGKKNDNRPENLILYIRHKNWHKEACPKCGFNFLVK